MSEPARKSLALLLARAARELPGPTFSTDDLAVAAWRRWPSRFSMEGHPYPDRHKAVCALAGPHGAVARGLLRRAGRKRYCLPGVQPVAEPVPAAWKVGVFVGGEVRQWFGQFVDEEDAVADAERRQERDGDPSRSYRAVPLDDDGRPVKRVADHMSEVRKLLARESA